MTNEPEIRQLPEEPEEKSPVQLTEEQVLPSPLPEVLGWRLLLQPMATPEKNENGLYYADETKQALEAGNYLFRVLDIGPKAFMLGNMAGEYARGGRLPQVGSWVVASHVAGQRITWRGIHLRICEDSAIMTVLEDPDGYEVVL